MTHWHALSSQDAVKELKSDRKDGLSQSEVKKRRKKYGSNALSLKRSFSIPKILFSQFQSPLIYILLFAAGLTLVLAEYVDTVVIIAAVVINVAIGFFQEFKSENTMEKLRSLVEPQARVIRDGKKHIINAEELVPGDIVYFEAGDRIPVDARLIEQTALRINEAILTGESTPSIKDTRKLSNDASVSDRTNMVYMGTAVDSGVGMAIVTHIGEHTQLGKIAALVSQTEKPRTPLQQRLAEFSRGLGVLFSVLTVVVFFVGIAVGRDFLEMILTAVAMAVAAIPEGLPASVTIILAVGSQKILEKKGLVRKLVSAETLGSTSVICTDKTGTLTKATMELVEVTTLQASKVLKDLVDDDYASFTVKIGMICNDSSIEQKRGDIKDWKIIGDTTDNALYRGGLRMGYGEQEISKEFKRIASIPFDASTKYMATLNHDGKKGCSVFLKGAPEVVMKRARYVLKNGKKVELEKKDREFLQAEYEKMTGRGLRVLGVAYKSYTCKQETLNDNDTYDLVIVGFLGLKDPLREQAKSSIQACRAAGIHVVVITGDHRLTAKAIFNELGIKVKRGEIMEGKDLDAMSDKKLFEKIQKVKVFARVQPEHKLRIIKQWQKHDAVVAMIGDGVNDAPAIKTADIGVAQGSGSDVSKEASELIILDDNLQTLVLSVEQGRVIFDNIRKVVVFNLVDSLSEIMVIGGSILLGMPLPLLPAQILWINIVEDGLPSLALAFEPGEADVMKHKPRKHDEPLMNGEMKLIILVIGLLSNILVFGSFVYMYVNNLYPLATIQTIVFATMAVNSLFYIFSIKSLRANIWKTKLFNNKYLLMAIFGSATLVIAAVYLPSLNTLLRTVPLAPSLWAIPIGLSVLQIIMIEIVKYFYLKYHKE